MTPAEFKSKFPEFASETDDRVQMFITDADPLFDVERWGDLYQAGLAFLVAHELAMANAQTALGGGVLAVNTDDLTTKVGDVQVTKDSAMLGRQSTNPYLRTYYGQRYSAYRRIVGIGAEAV